MYTNFGIVSTLILAIAGYAVVSLLRLLTKPRGRSLPPGPKPWPLIGNMADLPPSGVREWEFWLQHKDKYGPISSVTVLGTTIVLLHSLDLALELLERRSATHSSRPRSVFGGAMCGWDRLLALLPYGGGGGGGGGEDDGGGDDGRRMRAFRRPIHALLGTRAGVARFYGLQEVEVHRFLLRVLEGPERFRDHIRTEAGAIILKMAYGYTIDPHQRDPLVDIADRGLEQFSLSTVTGAWLVDTIPALQYLPEWMPGAGFKKTAKEWRATLMELAEKPMRFVRKQMAEKTHEDSYVSELLDKSGGQVSADEYDVVKWSAASLYTGGADTSVSVISTFFLAMTLHPEVQRKAHEEIDRVVGRDRLPTFADRDSLPYVEAVFKESFRWHALTPLGLPHVTTADDVCEGYLIPKGAIILPNIWWFCHDPAVYANPGTFSPSRFLGPDPAPDPAGHVFGFGRRVCPGRQLADSSVWLTLARSLAVFDVSGGVDGGVDGGAAGRGGTSPGFFFTPGVISHPVPFPARIAARSAAHEALVRRVEREHPWEKGSAGELEV